MTGLLGVQMIAGLAASSVDLIHPFSAAREVAAYITSGLDDRLPIVGQTDYCTSSVSGYLNRPLYYCASRGWGTFNSQDNRKIHLVTFEDFVLQVWQLMAERHSDVILILNSSIHLDEDRMDVLVPQPDGSTGTCRFILLNRFDHSIVANEAYALYMLKRLP